MSGYGVAAFRSRQQVMRFEQILRKEGLNNIRVISTPRDIAVGCGLSIQFDIKDIKTVQTMLTRAELTNLIGLFIVEQEGGRNKLIAISKRG